MPYVVQIGDRWLAEEDVKDTCDGKYESTANRIGAWVFDTHKDADKQASCIREGWGEEALAVDATANAKRFEPGVIVPANEACDPNFMPRMAPIVAPDPVNSPEHYQARDPYSELDRVLAMARAHAAEGKGKERHAQPGQPFEQQVIVADSVALGSNHGNLLQGIKKLKESARLPKDRAIAELLGVINNAAAAILVLEILDEANL